MHLILSISSSFIFTLHFQLFTDHLGHQHGVTCPETVSVTSTTHESNATLKSIRVSGHVITAMGAMLDPCGTGCRDC